jgi:3-oxoacyl-[acyl-carrier-protein] synthase-3
MSANGKNGPQSTDTHRDETGHTSRNWFSFWRGNGDGYNESPGGNGPPARLARNSAIPRRYAHIIGWGMALPERVLTNHDMEAIVETNHDWIVARTGIVERRIAGEKESTAHLALRAAQEALEVADLQPNDIDLIIVATSTPEHIFPSTASQVQAWLGSKYAGAYDISVACSGFVYGLDMASAKIRAGDMETVLVIGAETMSRVLNWSDRGTCILFGDGAGAVILQSSTRPGGILSSTLHSDGSGWDMLGVPTVGSRDTYLQDSKNDGENRELHRLHMNGREVFRFATRVVNESVRDVLSQAGLSLDDVSLIVPHQANQRIIESASRSLKIPQEKFYSNVDKYGNTSAASIPIALCEAIEEGRVQPGDNIVFVGFGGGLAWGAMAVQWETMLAEVPTTFGGMRRQVTYWYANLRRRVVRLWRQLWSYFSRTPTSNSTTIKQLRKRLEKVEWEEDKKEREPESVA